MTDQEPMSCLEALKLAYSELYTTLHHANNEWDRPMSDTQWAFHVAGSPRDDAVLLRKLADTIEQEDPTWMPPSM